MNTTHVTLLPMTEHQEDYIFRLQEDCGIKVDIPEELTRGQASGIIEFLLKMRESCG